MIQLVLSSTPPTAPAQTTTSTTRPVRSGIASSANGVYVPAMNRKIMEWSSRATSACRAGVDQLTR